MTARITAFLMGCVLLALPAVVAAAPPVLKADYAKFPRETLTAKSAIVVDAATGGALFEMRADEPRTAASLTKLMTAVIALEQKPRLARTVTMAAADEVGGGRLRLAVGTQLTWQDVFASALVASANNSAMALMRTSGLTRDRFIREMNVRAGSLGMTETRYYDPSGMDPRNVVTARDMARLSRYAFANPTIRVMTTRGSYTFTAYTPKAVVKKLTNTNRLLTTDPDIYITGGKTGYLEESQYNLSVRAKENGREVIIVTLGADARDKSFDETKALAHWAFQNYVWK